MDSLYWIKYIVRYGHRVVTTASAPTGVIRSGVLAAE
jgi:hypothetical protein